MANLKLVFKTNYHLMQVKREHSAILSTFIKLPVVIKTFVLSIFQWLFYTGFTVLNVSHEPVHEILVVISYVQKPTLALFILNTGRQVLCQTVKT